MFKTFAADVLGLSDIGIIVESTDFENVDADDDLFYKDQEGSTS